MSEDVCEVCGKRGWHEPCSSISAAVELRDRELDEAMLAKHSKHGAFGLTSQESQDAYDRAKQLLEAHLGRVLQAPAERSLEGRGWWFVPEGWVGMLGFVVEVESNTIFPLGSGLLALYGHNGYRAPWGAIEAYLDHGVEGILVSQRNPRGA